jgi:hypothetical protein
LRKFSNDFWENFSTEHFAASDFFEWCRRAKLLEINF